MSTPASAAPRRPYNIDRQVAHERAVKAAAARTTPDHHLSALERADLDDGHLRRLAALLAQHLGGAR